MAFEDEVRRLFEVSEPFCDYRVETPALYVAGESNAAGLNKLRIKYGSEDAVMNWKKLYDPKTFSFLKGLDSEAEGKILEDAAGKPYFDGKIKRKNSAEFQIPDDGKNTSSTLDQLVKSLNITTLFEALGGGGSDQRDRQLPATVTLPIPQGTAPAQSASHSLQPQRASLYLIGMH